MADHEPEIVMGRPQKLEEQRSEAINQPAQLLRIGAMLRELLEEVRRASPDEAGRKRLREIYDRALSVLKAGLSEELQQELDAFTAPLAATASESEIRIAQAQLLGWLEGLFQGIQAAVWAQQMEARAQLDGMRRRGLGLPSGSTDDGDNASGTSEVRPGQYL